MLRHPQDQPASIGVAEKWCKGPDADIPLKCENRNHCCGAMSCCGGKYERRRWRQWVRMHLHALHGVPSPKGEESLPQI